MNILKHLVFRGCLPLAILILALVSLVWAVTPYCPSGYMLIADGTKCVREQPRNVCPQNYTLSGGLCRHMDREASTCPGGTHFNSTSNNCTDSVPANVTCPAGYNYDPSSGKCVSYVAVIIRCPSNYQRSGLRTCQRTETPTCPSGFQINNLGTSCTHVTSIGPTCPTGSTYNSSKHVCEEFVTPSCPANHRLQNGQCVQRTQYQ